MEGIQGLSLCDGWWPQAPDWNGIWVEGLLVLAPSDLNLSELVGMVCSGVSGGWDALVYLGVYKAIHDLI